MGEGTDGSAGVAALHPNSAVLAELAEDDAAPDDRATTPEGDGPPSGLDRGRRRFTIASVVAVVVTSVPFLWILWGPWESPNPVRKTAYEDNFYDLQARAMFHGHLWLAKGAVGIEAFAHAGRQYTYFGIFPSLIRMPILLVTSRLDSKLTAPFILVAWLLTAVFAALLLWRVRILIRGQAGMGLAEAASFGAVMATIMGGSIFMFLAATPYVFAEDLAWSVCLTVGSLFALLGVLERPSWGRVIASGVLMLAANLDRLTTGWACVVGAILIAAWFGLGRAGPENRRWCIPMVIAGLVPLLAGSAVNYAKFGALFGLPVTDQLYTSVNAYRRKFLASNHNSEVGTTFVASDLLAYFRPDGLRLTTVFPFITLPAAPARALSGVLFDRRYRTASLPASMPLLFLLSCWGLITAFRPRPIGKAALTRILLLAAGAGGAALLLWGYIAPRYLADFVPFLVLASAVAMVDIWRRLNGRSRSHRIGAVAVISAVALFSIAANIGMAITPNEEWNTGQVLHYVEAQKAISDITGHPLNSHVQRGSALPAWAPADQLFVVGSCDGLYISNGENYSTVPAQQFQRTTWMAVERGPRFQHVFSVMLNRPGSRGGGSAALVTAGDTTVVVAAQAGSRTTLVRALFVVQGPNRRVYGLSALVTPGSTHQVVVITDQAKHLVQVSMDGSLYLSGTLAGTGPIGVDTPQAHSVSKSAAVSATDVTGSLPGPNLCHSLIG